MHPDYRQLFDSFQSHIAHVNLSLREYVFALEEMLEELGNIMEIARIDLEDDQEALEEDE